MSDRTKCYIKDYNMKIITHKIITRSLTLIINLLWLKYIVNLLFKILAVLRLRNVNSTIQRRIIYSSYWFVYHLRNSSMWKDRNFISRSIASVCFARTKLLINSVIFAPNRWVQRSSLAFFFFFLFISVFTNPSVSPNY